MFAINGNRVQTRNMVLGAREGDDQIILSGLAPGEQTALGDLTQLAGGKKIRVLK